MDQSIILSLSFLCGVSRSPDAAGTLAPVCLDISAVVCAPLAMAMGEDALIPPGCARWPALAISFVTVFFFYVAASPFICVLALFVSARCYADAVKYSFSVSLQSAALYITGAVVSSFSASLQPAVLYLTDAASSSLSAALQLVYDRRNVHAAWIGGERIKASGEGAGRPLW